MMRSILEDVRYTLRQFRKAPGFAFTVVAVLALGIGANIAVFMILNGIRLRPLPYAHPDRIVMIEPTGPMPYYNMTYANMLQLRDAVGPRMKIGAEIFGEGGGMVSVVGPGGRFQIVHPSVTAGLFAMLGVQPNGLTFSAVILVLAVSAFAAAWLPARRAAAVDPILALRSE